MKCGLDTVPGGREHWRIGRMVSIGYVLIVILCFSRQTLGMAFDNTSSTFVERCRADCGSHRDFVTCGKYKAIRWLHDVVREKEFGYGPFRIVRIPSMPSRMVLPTLPQSRVFRSGAIETLNFVKDAIEDLLTKRAIVYTIDNSAFGRNFGSMPMIMDEDELSQMQSRKDSEDDWRIFKKKKSMIVPVLILLNLMKLKLLLLPIFLGVHFIKKLLVLGSLIAPSILAHLKICKVQPPQHIHPHHVWATAAEGPIDYPTGYGQEETWVHRNDYQGNIPYPVYHGYRNTYG